MVRSAAACQTVKPSPQHSLTTTPPRPKARWFAAITGTAALLTMAVITVACSETTPKPTLPSRPTVTTATKAAPKTIGDGNKVTPSVKAPPPNTVAPGKRKGGGARMSPQQ